MQYLSFSIWLISGFPGALVVKNLPASAEVVRLRFSSLGLEDSLEEGIAALSSIPARRISWTEEPRGL